jgi:alcohol dehydrogenase (cytochrome c)
MYRKFGRSGLLAAAAALVIAGSGTARFVQPLAASSQALAAGGANVDWPRFGNMANNTRFSTLTQVNTANVSRLGVAWTMQEGHNLATFEDDPIVVNGVMYITTGVDQVRAVNAATGKLLWQYTPKVNFYESIHGGGGGAPTSRGVAVGKNAVYLLTYDDQLISLQASTGEVLWHTTVANAALGYNETSPVTYWDGMLFVGSAVSDAGLRGFVAAFNATTGKQVWRFYTVPAPGHGWDPATGDHGGGDVWMPPTIDTKTGILYFGTGNPSPDFVNTQRPGCDPYVDSTIALNAKTGKMLWAHTEVCPDLWDYDSHQPIQAVGQGNKSGRFFIFDAKTGKMLAISPYVADATVPHQKPTPQGAKECPGWLGGMEFSPAAYSPYTQAVYEQGINICMVYHTASLAAINGHKSGAADTGGYVTPFGKYSGTMSAIDVNTGKFLWHEKMPAPMVGGVLATAGNLVFAGSDNGRLYAFDARTGKILWQPNLGIDIGAAPITYEINGTQYIAVAAGGPGAVAYDNMSKPGGTMVVFKLNGSPIKPLPAVVTAPTPAVGLPSLKGMTKINPWMYANAKTQTLVLKVVAASNGANSGFNFDGYAKGKANFIIPQGWGVTIEFSNAAALPHSLAIAASNKPNPKLPVFGFGPALTPNAFTTGTPHGVVQVIGFGANPAGTYYMDCLIPGHLQAGMWDRFTISNTATMPTIAMGS